MLLRYQQFAYLLSLGALEIVEWISAIMPSCSTAVARLNRQRGRLLIDLGYLPTVPANRRR